ncbi:helix-turn-helix transcriptional regulator [Paenibacillus sp. IHBB 3054]|uniref:helix-turn-helix transcriptional regulator n=1 Tax=Paenibacillus sp. IHBB 3054 TaxID=3425689 RepID=UPI003F66C958
MLSENSKAKTLGDYLKSRRNRLQPEQAGLKASYSQRRTPGLRREEVAMLAGVSATYYTWLEQGREVTASRDIIENIGRALQLTPDEQQHLFELWNPHERAAVSSISTTLNPQWREIIGQLPYPSFISNERSEVLAWNEEAAKMLIDFDAIPDSERLMIRLLFLDSGLRRRMINWEEFTLHSVAVFRTYYDKHPEDPWFQDIVEQLCVESREFADIWKLHNIQLKTVNRVYIQTPAGDDKTVAYDIHSFASPTDHPDLHVCVYTPVKD